MALEKEYITTVVNTGFMKLTSGKTALKGFTFLLCVNVRIITPHQALVLFKYYARLVVGTTKER